MTATLRHSLYIGLRDLRNLARQPWWIAISLAQPLVYLLLYSALFENVAEIPGFKGESYLDFVVPGIVLMSAMFSGGWAGMAIINDLDRGVTDRFLVTPVKRGALIAGRLMQHAIVVVIQSLILVGLGLAIGAEFPGGVLGVAVLIASAIVLSTAFGALSIGLALVVRKEESVIGAVQLLLLPLTFLSSIFMQRDLMPGWIREVARFNPADWAVQAGREAVRADVDWSLVFSNVGYLAAFTLASAWLATRGFRTYQRSV
jgi:ABC-2 type transport system permease protein